MSKPTENAAPKAAPKSISQPKAAANTECSPELRPIVEAERRRAAPEAANLAHCSTAISSIEATILPLTTESHRQFKDSTRVYLHADNTQYMASGHEQEHQTFHIDLFVHSFLPQKAIIKQIIVSDSLHQALLIKIFSSQFDPLVVLEMSSKSISGVSSPNIPLSIPPPSKSQQPQFKKSIWSDLPATPALNTPCQLLIRPLMKFSWIFQATQFAAPLRRGEISQEPI